jgi:hypothetical protein
MPNKKSAKKPKQKPIAVTRSFLLGLADTIFNPKSQKFLRLCHGTLQNGPDPTDKKRTMHCGLGELYFAMAHRQPEEDHVDESSVVNIAIELSAFGSHEDKRARATAAIEKMDVPDAIKDNLLEQIDNSNEEDFQTEEEDKFRVLLASIPDENDEVPDNDSGRDDFCTFENFRTRARHVAKVLRQAAKLLPE